jgi:hypothetical protein
MKACILLCFCATIVAPYCFAQENPAIDREACGGIWSHLREDGAIEISISEGFARSLLVSGGRPVVVHTHGDALVTGKVIVYFEIDKAGDPKYVTACGGSTLLRPVAVSAVSKWKFKPYLLDSRPVAVTASAVVPVTLQPSGDR